MEKLENDMKHRLLTSLVTLSLITNLYGEELKSSAQIMKDALAQMEALVAKTATDANDTNNQPFTLGKYGTFKFEKANDNVYIMHGPVVSPNKENQGFMNNPAVIESEHGLIVIDPGGNYNIGKKVLAEIEKVSKKPILAVFNTHKHGDHWFANKAIVEKYPNVDIYAHSNMIKVSKEGEAEVWYGILSRTTGNLEGTKEFAFPTKALEDGQEIEVDGQKFVIQHPHDAHTDTDLVIAHMNSMTLFLGDNLMKGRLGSFDESSSIFGNIELLENIKKETNFKLYVPGHGLSGEKDKTIDPFLNYLKVLAEEGKTAYEEDLESYEIKEDVMKKLSWMNDWDAFKKNMPTHLNKVMIELGEQELAEEESEE
jgi:glyoxylase-like metal-dependent hydrolase (beta-lactamase superfamily II)